MKEMSKPKAETMSKSSRSTWNLILFLFLVPVVVATLFYNLDSFDPAPLPLHELSPTPIRAPLINDNMLQGAELLGVGNLKGPEDLAYDHNSGLIYTGCEDGWIKRLELTQGTVDNWVNTGGRPLGLALGLNHDQLIVADTDKGLLKVSKNGQIEVLTDEAEGKKFKLTDDVDVAKDGMIYFTDASYKYSMEEHIWDVLEGRPYGRLLSFNPETKETKVLVHDIYFANGVAVSPDQRSVIFCETVMRRCKKFHIEGEKKGTVESFVQDIPGLPDNIRYDGQGIYWIGIVSEITPAWDLSFKYPFIRKVAGMIHKTIGMPRTEKNGGVFAVDLEGNPVAHYFDSQLAMVSSGIKIGDFLYCGSVAAPYIIKLNVTQHPAIPINNNKASRK